MIDINKLRSEKDDPLKQIVSNPIKTIDYTIEDIANRIDSISPAEIKDVIERQHSIFLSYDLFISSPAKRRILQKLFTNVEFLKILNSVVGKLNLSNEEVICANKLCYDYYVSVFKDMNIITELLTLSYTINFNLAIKLTPMVGVENAKTLAMIYNSSFTMEKRVDRVNTFLMNYSFTDLSVQDIINIMSILFDKQFTKVFIAFMLHTKDPNYDNNKVARFDKISNAIIELVDSLSMKDINMLFLDYSNYIRINIVRSVRFSFKTVTGKERIMQVIKQVENSGWLIP